MSPSFEQDALSEFLKKQGPMRRNGLQSGKQALQWNS